MRSGDNQISSPDISSYTISSSSESQSPYSANFAAEPGSSSPNRHPTPPWAEVPVSYVPANRPTGPRELPDGHYVCPDMYCKFPVGLTASGQGYNRDTLMIHMLSHGEFRGVRELWGIVRYRVRQLRHALGRTESNEDDEFHHSSEELDEDGYLRLLTVAFIRDLDEIKAWELSCRHMRPFSAAQEARADAHEYREVSDSPFHDSEMEHELRVNGDDVGNEILAYDDSDPPQENPSRLSRMLFDGRVGIPPSF